MGNSVEITQNTARSKVYSGAAIAALFLYCASQQSGTQPLDSSVRSWYRAPAVPPDIKTPNFPKL